MPQDDYFNDGPEESGKPAGDQKESSDEQTFVLPKSIAGGKTFKPGDEMVVEIVAEHEDSFEVKYAAEAPAEEKEPEEEPESEMPMEGEMADSMME